MAVYHEPCWSYAFEVGADVPVHRFVASDAHGRAVLPHGAPVLGVLEAMLGDGDGVVTTNGIVEVDIAEGERIWCGPHEYVTSTGDGKARMATPRDRRLGVAMQVVDGRVRVALGST
jgi:hypothetical protein